MYFLSVQIVYTTRCNNYKMNNRYLVKGQTSMLQHLFEYFANKGRCSFLENITITFIDKTNPKDPKRREHYWKHTLKTIIPLDLNGEDD